jgi:hypothetical protein
MVIISIHIRVRLDCVQLPKVTKLESIVKQLSKMPLIFLGLAALGEARAVEDNNSTVTRVMQKKTVILPVEVSAGSVHLSRADYSTPLVKILVPALADITLLDHRNFSEGAPCMATNDTKRVDDVIQGRPATENVPFNVTLTKIAYVDKENNICRVTLEESLDARIRGFTFTHVRYSDLPDRVVEDCR